MDLTKSFKRTHREQTGTSMLETAIVLPFLLLILFSIIEGGLLFAEFITVTNAAREGAREAIVFEKNCNVGTVESAVRASIQTYTASAGITTTDGDIAITGACSAPGTNVTVSVNNIYTYEVLAAIAPSLNPTVNVSGQSIMRHE